MVLFVLARILEKSAFGDAMTVFAFYRIGSMGLGSGIAAILLYHISRNPDDKMVELRLHRTMALGGAILSAIFGAGCAWGAGPIAETLFHKPSLTPWFVAFAPFMLFSTLNTVAIGALDGRSRITEALLVAEAAPNALRLVFLPLGAFLAMPDTMVAHAMTLSVAIPWLFSARRLLDRSVVGFEPLHRWDVGYGSKFVLYSFSSLTLQGFDILVVSALFSSSTAADYAVAARLASLYPFLQQIVVRQFSPKAGRLLQLKDYAKLQTEVDGCRRASAMAVSLCIAVIVGAMPLVLPFFGDFQAAIPIALLLTLPPVIRSVFASCDRVMQMAGYANWALVIQFTALAVVTGLPFATHSQLGIASIPMAMAIASLFLNPISAIILRRRLGLKTLNKRDALLIFSTACVVGASMTIPTAWAALLVACFFVMAAVVGALATGKRCSAWSLVSTAQSLGGRSEQG